MHFRSNHSQQTATGYIIAVQEERFRLMTDSGDTLLLTLPNLARVSVPDLHRWHTDAAHVRVTFEGSPNLASGVARSIQPLPNNNSVPSLAKESHHHGDTENTEM